jgi:hypothetical protein
MQRKRLVAIGTGLAALAVAASAPAETLIYVTQGAIGTVDSSAVGTDNTSGGNGPLSYTLPSGYATVGAKVSDDSQTLFLLTYNGTACQLFAVNADGGSGGAAQLTGVNSAFDCTINAGGGDFDFLNGTGGSATDEYLVANASSLLEIAAGGASASASAVSNASGGSGDLVGVANVGSSPNFEQYGIDAGTGEVVQLGLGTDPATEADVVSLGFSTGGSTSFAYSEASGAYYLYTNGGAYATDSLSSGFTALGSTPGGTVSLVPAENVAVSNSGGGAFGPAALLPLLGLAALRRRKQARQEA